VNGEAAPRNPVEGLVGSPRTTIPELFEARVRATPGAPFLRWDGRTWTYEEAWDEASRFAGWLLSTVSGANGDLHVASFLPNRPEAMWAWLGTLLAGATYVPLNRAHRGDLLLDMLVRSEAAVVVTDAEGMGDLPLLSATVARTVVCVGEPVERGDAATPMVAWSSIASHPPARGRAPAPADVAEVMYTSGTTGRSKAVLLSHNQLVRGAGWVAWSLAMDESDVIHAWMPLFHIAGQLNTTLATMIGGGTVALYPTFSRSAFWSQVGESGATVFIGFSNVLEILWALPPDPADSRCSLRAGIMGGIPPKLHRPFEQRFGLRLSECYGMTEGEPLVLPAPGSEYPVGSLGRQSPDFEVAVVDDEDQRLPPGSAGQIVCRPRVADVLSPGYHDDPDATLTAFRNLWFHTGDVGRIDEDGFVSFVDRGKHAIRRRGENISSWELEGLIAAHPAVAECCAVGVPSPLGEEDVKIVVVPEPGERVDPAELRAWCVDRMASFMLPRYVEVLDELPRNSLGKLLKSELRDTGPGTWDVEMGNTTGGRA
jgi:carnitine-CoA ligase